MVEKSLEGRRPSEDFWDFVRSQIIGTGTALSTPFGTRLITYADYTASGRGVEFVERYMHSILEVYGNTHTEDDATGMTTTIRLAQAEASIKRLVGAGSEYKIVMTGAGSTGAIHRLQQILGVYIPPAAKDLIRVDLDGYFRPADRDEFVNSMKRRRPVVFVGPYEHHSNEVSWRECWVDVVEIDLTPDGLIDLDDLERKASDSKYAGRTRIGAFSAASNVSGVMTPVSDVARILHRHGALALFDFAAIAPYAEIRMCRDDECYFDAIYFSPHKFLGGPGSNGVLIFHERLYRKDLAPTIAGGGTVNYVWAEGQDYIEDIEAREKAGTPGILQTLRASLAMELKERLGVARIARREAVLIRRALSVLGSHPAVEIIGPSDPDARMSIVSFNLRVEDSYLHPRFVTVLLNDLFGIQSRAGCSCAGPYGHRLLHLDAVQSEALRRRIATGVAGLKPGWVRVNFHYLMTDEEFDFLCRSILFVAEQGRAFLPLYAFDVQSGGWGHRTFHAEGDHVRFGLDAALAPDLAETSTGIVLSSEDRARLHDEYLTEAEALARKLRTEHGHVKLKTTERDLIPFVYV